MNFDDFVHTEGGTLAKLAVLLVHNPADADDVAQEALILIYQHWAKVAAATSPQAYARTVLIRVARRANRRVWRRQEVLGPPTERSYVQNMLTSLAFRDLRSAFASLTGRQREAVALRYICDESIENTSRIMGCSVGAVKSQTSKGLTRLRALLTLQEEPAK